MAYTLLQMKLTVLQTDLQKAVQVASRFVSTRSQLPILANIKLKAEKTKLIISATNLEMGLTTKVGANVESEGEISIPAKAFLDLIQNISSDKITIESKEEKVIIKGDSSRTTLSANNTADFPEIPTQINDDATKISTKEFSKALPQVAFCSSPDDTRPALSGCLFIFDTQTTMVASDGYRLSKRTISVEKNSIKAKIILPKQLIGELLKLINESEENFLIYYSESEKQIFVEFDNFLISSRIVDGEYPNFEKIIPSASRIKVNVSKQELLQTLKVISVIAREAANIAEFDFSNNKIKISAQSNKSGEGESEIEAKVEGGSLSIMFNYKFMIDFLNSIDTDNVLIELNDTTSAGVFRDASNENYLHLIMPVKL